MTALPETPPAPLRRLSLPEFTAMLAMLFATIAFSIDAMLPALPAIAAELSPSDVNRAQLILSAFVLGMGVGTLFAGPISDAVGRRPAIVGGFAIYILGAVLAFRAPSLELLLAARVIQGLGAAAPRIVSLALVRDLYAGREMARVTSFIMMVFILVPAVAPFLGQTVIAAFGWRSIFVAFVIFAVAGSLWLMIRQPETLSPERRRPLSLPAITGGVREVLSNREVVMATLVMTLGFGQMFALLSSIQQIFADTFGQGPAFPMWFALIALVSGSASVMNARLVMRVGMRQLALRAYAAQAVFSAVMVALWWAGAFTGTVAFVAFFLWAASIFFMAGLTFGNLQALALQRMGHLAGMAASVISAVSTVGAVGIAAPIGLLFDGTPLPVMSGAVLCSGVALLVMRRLTDPV